MRPLFLIQPRAPRASLKIKSYALTHSRQRGATFCNSFSIKLGMAKKNISLTEQEIQMIER